MRILVFATGDIALPTLRWLLAESGHEIVGLITQPDRPVGRRQILTPPAVKTLALAHGIPIWQPERLRREISGLSDFSADLGVVMAYGQILPRAALNAPALGCWNLHASLLPRHRGAAPIQAAILAGDRETGITVMQMDEGLDTGAMLHQLSVPILDNETGGQLHDRLAELAPHALADALKKLASGTLIATPQDATQATHIGKLTREFGRIDWARDAATIARQVRALVPWPGSSAVLRRDGQTDLELKIHRVAISTTSATGLQPGTLLPELGLSVATGQDCIKIQELQSPGGRRMTSSEWLKGHFLPAGSRFLLPNE